MVSPNLESAYKLMHEGSLALADVERAGMRVDTDVLKRTKAEVTQRIRKLEIELQEDEVWKLWRRRYGASASLGSRVQLGTVLFDDMGHEPQSRTKTARAKVDEVALNGIDIPFIRTYLCYEKLKKLLATYLKGVEREVVDGFIHPVFNLHLVRTYRSSSDSPNFQNQPVRDKEIGELIRSCFVPRDGHAIVEIDYGSLEVRIAACYHHDPTMLAYIRDPSKDMHRDMAAECYKLEAGQVTKEARFAAKNQFVFPEFYGSYFAQCAPQLWASAMLPDVRTVDGESMKSHLASEGLKKLGTMPKKGSPPRGTFLHHIMKVENRFWGKRFHVYDQWRKDWWESYQETGKISLLTGFEIVGPMKRNDCINYPVQGAAFHCLLWSLIQMNKELQQRKMKTVIVGQVHDSLVADVHLDELDIYMELAREIMTERIVEHWPWIIVPLEVEAEIGYENWWQKKPIEIGVGNVG